MAFGDFGSRDGEVRPEMNVTPLVDVVLVLLIIFMVVSPLLNRTFWVHAPRQETREVEALADPDDRPIVLRLGRDGRARVNGVEIPLEELSRRLQTMFAARAEEVLFFDADDEVDYGLAVRVMDRAREGGARTVAVLTEPLHEAVGSP